MFGIRESEKTKPGNSVWGSLTLNSILLRTQFLWPKRNCTTSDYSSQDYKKQNFKLNHLILGYFVQFAIFPRLTLLASYDGKPCYLGYTCKNQNSVSFLLLHQEKEFITRAPKLSSLKPFFLSVHFSSQINFCFCSLLLFCFFLFLLPSVDQFQTSKNTFSSYTIYLQ